MSLGNCHFDDFLNAAMKEVCPDPFFKLNCCTIVSSFFIISYVYVSIIFFDFIFYAISQN